MASAAVDCRPLRDTNTLQPALATLRTATEPVSSPTAAAAGGQPRTPGGSRRVVYHGQLYAAEAVGRKCAVMQLRNGSKVWDKAMIVEYNPAAGQHKLKYSNSKQEEWQNLSELRFKWSQVLPLTAPPNPTYKPEFSKEAAVGKRLRVYWPAMQKWYYGIVKSYDPRSDKHLVSYRDGDTQALVLRHEPVIWCDDEPSINGTSSSEQVPATTPRHSTSMASTPKSLPVPAATAPAAMPADVLPAAAVVERPALRSRSPAVRAPASAAVNARSALAAAFGAASSSAAAEQQQQQQQQQPPQPRSASATAKATSKAAAGNQAAAALTRAGSGGSKGSAGATAGKAAAAAASGAANTAAAEKAPARANLQPSKSATVSAVNGAVHAQKAGLTARTPAVAAATAAAAPSSGNHRSDPVQQKQRRASDPGDSRQQPPRAGSALGKHSRDSSGPDSLSKRLRRSSQPAGRTGAAGAGTAAAAPGRAGQAAIQDKHLAVGCRVAVWWRLDKLFYRGKLTSYAPSSGKYTIKYDDGQSEALLLEKERFVWHAPRACSAGYRPALHTLMQQLGADGMQPLPETGPDGKIVPVTQGPENAPHPPCSGAGAVGWRIKLYWAADRAWHEAEVLSYDEARHKHHLLYLDGEEEWLDLARETVRWLKATRHGAISAGQITSDDLPKGRDAVGWRIAVYWKDDRTFYEGEVRDYEASTGRHKVLYNDGEEEWLHLRNERVIWRLPPSEESDSEASGDDSDLDISISGEEDTTDSEEEDSEEDEDEEELARQARERGRLKALRGRTRGRATAGSGRRRAHNRRAGVDSDSGSASGGAAAGAEDDDHIVGSAGIYSHAAAAEAVAGGAAGATGDVDSLTCQQLLSGQLGAGAGSGAAGGAGAGADRHPLHPLHLQLKLGNRAGANVGSRAGQGSRGPGISAGAGGIGGKGSLQRQGSSGLPAGRGPGGSFGGCGPLNLPPLQVLRRASADGAAGLGSPLRPIQVAEQLQLLVRIVPGAKKAGKAAVAAGAAIRGTTAPTAPEVSAVTGVSTGGNASAAAAEAAALKPLLQKLPLRQQRAAARLQRKMERLHMILGKLSTTAGAMGWKLDNVQLPTASHKLLAAAAAAATQQQAAAGGGCAAEPMSPTTAARKRGAAAASTNPISPRAVKAPRSAAAAAAGGCGSLPVSPRGPLSPGPCSPTASSAAAGRPVPVVKTCAVKSKPGQSNGSGQRLNKMRSPSSTPTHAASSSGGAGALAGAGSGAHVQLLGSPAAMDEGAGAAASAPVGVTDGTALPTAGDGVSAAAAAVAVIAADVGAPAVHSPPSQQQHVVEQQGTAQQAANASAPPAAQAATIAAPTAAVAPGDAAVASVPAPPAAALAPTAVTLAPVAPAAAAPAPAPAAVAPAEPAAAEQEQPSPPLANGNGSSPGNTAPAASPPPPAAAAAAEAEAASVETPARKLPALPSPSPLDATNPAAPSASLTADDVVLKLQAIAAAQGGSSGDALQQHLHKQAAASAGSSPAEGPTANGAEGARPSAVPMETD